MSAQAQAVVDALVAKGWMLATAESCTGGLIAAALTDIAGSSNAIGFGFVTYSNEAKMKLLNVQPDLLAQHGAVSEETARAMALGAQAASGAHMAISVTGIAGPGGAVPGKPVGTVCFALALNEQDVQSWRQHFSGDRQAVRRASVEFALTQILHATAA